MASLSACSSLHHRLELTSGYSPPVNAKILLDEIKVKEDSWAPIRRGLQKALNRTLTEENLAWKLKGRPLILAVEVIEHSPEASTWLPGLKSSALAIRAIVKENDRIVGVAEIKYKKLGFGHQPPNVRDQMFYELAQKLIQDLRAKLYAL